MNIAGRLFVFVHGSVCACICGHVCVHMMQYQSHSPQHIVQENDRERVPDPNWASGALRTPPVIRCMCLMQYQRSTTLLLIQTIREEQGRVVPGQVHLR